MSTSFLVIQAQRDLAQAKQNELGAVLGYDLALVDFEALQEAGPGGGGLTAGSSTGQPPAAVAAAAATAPVAAAPRATAIPGIQQ